MFRSTAADPRPTVPLTLTSDDAWRRFELTSTSVWSGAMPRSVAGRIVSVPSARPGRGKFSDGRATDRAWLISVVPAFFSDSAEMMSTGGGGIERAAVGHAGAGDDHGGAVFVGGRRSLGEGGAAGEQRRDGQGQYLLLRHEILLHYYLPSLVMNCSPL